MLTGPRLRDSVVIRHAPEIPGPYNSVVQDWANATSTTEAAELEQVGATEDVVLQERTETRWRLFLRPGAALTAQDRVEWDGKTLEVVGEPDRPRVAGRIHHCEAVLRAVSGG